MRDSVEQRIHPRQRLLHYGHAARPPHDRHRQLSVPGLARVRDRHLEAFGADDLAEMLDDAVAVAVKDQVDAGLDAISDGEQTRLDFNLSFYGFLEGLAPEPAVATPLRAARARSARQARGDRRTRGAARARHRGGVPAPASASRPRASALKASVPGPYTLSGRLVPGGRYRGPLGARRRAGADRASGTRGAGGCGLHGRVRRRAVDELLRASRGSAPVRRRCSTTRSAGVRGRTRLSTHLCFGNFKGRAVAPRSYAPLFPGVPRRARRRTARGDGEPRVRRTRGDRGDRRSAWTSPSASST